MTGSPNGKECRDNHVFLLSRPEHLKSSCCFLHHFVSNIGRDSPDCLIIPNNVPVLNSSCSGTGMVIVEFPLFFCMMIWLPFCLTFSNPCSERILQISQQKAHAVWAYYDLT